MGFLAWLLVSVAVIVSFDLLLFTRGHKGWQRFFGTFFLFYAQIVITELLLGWFAILTGPAVIVSNLLIAFGIMWATRRLNGEAILTSYITRLRVTAGVWMKSLKGDPLYAALLVLALIVIGWIVLLGLLFPVTDFDGNAYHMSFIAQAIHDHQIHDVPTSIPWLSGYPKGGELIQMWNVIVPGTETLADLAQLPFILLGIVSIYALCRRLGVTVKDARFASLLFLFIPVLINQAKTTYVDIMLSSLFLAGLAWVTKKSFSKFDFFVTGIIFSLLLSIKSTGLLFVLACLPFLALKIVRIKNRKIVPDYKQYFTKIGLVLLPLLPGLYWYIKNLIAHGSPLYPFGLKLFGTEIFPGRTFQDFISTAFTNSYLLPEGMFQRLWFVWTEQKDWFGCLYNYDATFSGLGPVWFVLLLPSILLAVIIAIRRRNYLFLAVAAVGGAVFLVYPANFYSRYVLFMVGIGLLAFGLVCTTLGGVARGFARLVALWLAFVVAVTTFTLCNFPPSIVRDQLNNSRAGNARESIAYLNAVGASYSFLQQKIESGDVVVYDSSPTYIYPLWKDDFSNKVVYIPSDSAGEWYDKLEQNDADYVFTAINSKEHKWLQNDQPFRSIYKDTLYEIYEVH